MLFYLSWLETHEQANYAFKLAKQATMEPNAQLDLFLLASRLAHRIGLDEEAMAMVHLTQQKASKRNIAPDLIQSPFGNNADTER